MHRHRNVVCYSSKISGFARLKTKTYSDTLSFLYSVEDRVTETRTYLSLYLECTLYVCIQCGSNPRLPFHHAFIGSTSSRRYKDARKGSANHLTCHAKSLLKGKCYNNNNNNNDTQNIPQPNTIQTHEYVRIIVLHTQWRTTRYIHGIVIQASWLSFYFLSLFGERNRSDNFTILGFQVMFHLSVLVI